ncbi:MAG TPA: hypothetical protein VMU61_04720 [Candidatus Aquilonibacter sp.]|nr:hypothetical protein [Candidatus Aquilonibacter sp.]
MGQAYCEGTEKAKGQVIRKATTINRTARKHEACGPPGGLFGIDQEVVTLRGLYGNSGVAERRLVVSAILTDLRQAESILTHR